MNPDIQALVELASQHKWVALAALVVGTLVRAMKADSTFLPFDVPARWRPLLALGLGISSGVLQKATTGTPWREAIMGGVISGVMAIVGHDVLIEGLRAGREVPMGTPKAAPVVPPAAPPSVPPPAEDTPSSPLRKA